ncbi:MAG: sirohydrochlorin chelatase [Acidobacteriota bacterium]
MKKRRAVRPAVKTGLLVIGHGSRVPGANQVLAQVASSLRRQFRPFVVEHAFLELAQPDIQAGIDRCVEQGALRILLVPYFLYLGGHVGRDIPEHIAQGKARHPGLEIRIAPHLDFDRRIVAVACDRIRAGLRAGKWA